MKYCLFVIIIFLGTSLNKVSSIDNSKEPYIPVLFFSQQAPFYFLNSIPPAVKLPGKINLSFFRNQSVVFQYRYKLELPYGTISDIDRRLITWSGWTKDNLTELNVSRFDQEGGYKLIIEYMTPELGETKKFEKPFYVYRDNPKANEKIAEAKTSPVSEKAPVRTAPASDKTPAKPSSTKPTTQVTDKTPVKPSPADIRAASGTIPVTVNKNKGNEPANNIETDLNDSREKINPEEAPSAGNVIVATSEKTAGVERDIEPDYNKLLAEAIEKKDPVLFRNSIQNGADWDIKNIDGGNILHIIDGTLANEELISILLKKGVSISETDSYGNSPLHVALIEGENEYAKILISQGADLNIKNNLELSPLHIAVFLDYEEVVKKLLNQGAEINLKGNSGYTPLHIASEMNHLNTAKDLLMMGAKSNLKTDQKLTSKAIAKIQRNKDMSKIIGKKGSYVIDSPDSYSINSVIALHTVRQNPKYDFNLPFDNELVKKRQFNKVIQIITVPIFIAGTSITAQLNHKANSYYSLYKTAESEAIAKDYYDKTKKYDSYTYISGGISLVNLYGFIHSTLRKKITTGKMYKTFN